MMLAICRPSLTRTKSLGSVLIVTRPETVNTLISSFSARASHRFNFQPITNRICTVRYRSNRDAIRDSRTKSLNKTEGICTWTAEIADRSDRLAISRNSPSCSRNPKSLKKYSSLVTLNFYVALTIKRE